MKRLFACAPLAVLCLASCTTLENRRDMYCGYGKVNGPYTRMVEERIKRKKIIVFRERTTTTTSDYKSVR